LSPMPQAFVHPQDNPYLAPEVDGIGRSCQTMGRCPGLGWPTRGAGSGGLVACEKRSGRGWPRAGSGDSVGTAMASGTAGAPGPDRFGTPENGQKHGDGRNEREEQVQ